MWVPCSSPPKCLLLPAAHPLLAQRSRRIASIPGTRILIERPGAWRPAMDRRSLNNFYFCHDMCSKTFRFYLVVLGRGRVSAVSAVGVGSIGYRCAARQHGWLPHSPAASIGSRDRRLKGGGRSLLANEASKERVKIGLRPFPGFICALNFFFQGTHHFYLTLGLFGISVGKLTAGHKPAK